MRPKLGGRVTGTVVPPAGFAASDLVGTRVELEGWLIESMSLSYQHSAIIGSDLTFAFDALNGPADIDLTVQWNDRPLVSLDGLDLRRGKNSHVKVQMLEGAQIAGTVVDAEGSPLEGVSVWRGGRGRSEAKGSQLVRTDSRGAFELTNVAPGTQTVSAQIRGRLHSSLNVALSDGERLENVELILKRGEKLEGILLDESGNPQADLWVGLERVETGEGSHSNCGVTGSLSIQISGGVRKYVHRYMVATTSTNEDGRFVFETLPAGRMSLWASANIENGAGRVLLRKAIEPSDEIVRIEHERILPGAKSDSAKPERATITGRVLGPGSKPVQHALVTATPLWSTTTSIRFGGEAMAATDEEGRYSLQIKERGPVEVYATGDGFVMERRVARVEGGSSSTLDFALNRGGVLQGSAKLADGKPAAGYWAYAIQSTGEEYLEKRVNSRGGFTFAGLAPGYWSVELYDKENEELIVFGHALVVQGEMAKIELLAARPPVDVFGALSVGGRPLESASITFQPIGFDENHLVGIESVDYDGWYQVRLPGAGMYEITILRGGFFAVFSRRIPAGPEVQLDFEIPAGTVSGRLVSSSGEPIAYGSVLASTILSLEHESWGAYIDVESDEQGHFQFSNLPTGVYRIAAGPHTEFLEWTHPGVGDAGLSNIEVLANQSLTGIRLELPVSMQAEGVVLDRSGAGVAGAEVFGLVDGALLIDEPLATTDEQGRFAISQLAPNVELFATTRHRRSSSVPLAANSKIELRLEPATLLLLFGLDENGVDVTATYRILDAEGRECPPRYDYDLKLGQDEYAFGPLFPGTYKVFGHGGAGARVIQDCTILDEVELKLTVRFPPAE